MFLKIHGDNIVECERTLNLLCEAYEGTKKLLSGTIYSPRYGVFNGKNKTLEVELLSGHHRWAVNFHEELRKFNAPLRESPDAYVTIVEQDKERIIFALEYCSALPAGNNAWQRNGRALTCAVLGIPYFYFADFGGVELDSNRNIKAPRFPNPIVPFSYLSASNSLDTICLPVYEAHPAISASLREEFQPIFGLDESFILIRNLIEKKALRRSIKSLTDKGLILVKLLSENRKRIDTFRGKEWKIFLKKNRSLDKANWIVKNENSQIWKKKFSNKVKVTPSFKKLSIEFQKLNCLSIGAKNIPICLIPSSKLADFNSILEDVYGNKLTLHLKKNINSPSRNYPLLVVWITGFKPRGDDSRPDRGLLPLARMLFGNDITILTIVYGPAHKQTWSLFQKNPLELIEKNGLWEAILNLSDMVLADSITSEFGAMLHYNAKKVKNLQTDILLPLSLAIPNQFSEHDVDTAIHLLFGNQIELGIFEGMCNPPGGDWSGISLLHHKHQIEYRWTSLPRVSSSNGKRPDHVIQFILKSSNVYLVIESKTRGKTLSNAIGIRLRQYLKDLINHPPIASKPLHQEWSLFEETYIPLQANILSAAAFCYTTLDEMKHELERGKLDIVFAFDFKDLHEVSELHLLFSKQGLTLKQTILSALAKFSTWLEVQIH